MRRESRRPRPAATPATAPRPRPSTPRWAPSRPVVPRDRAGSFTPRLVRKGQRRMDGLDAMIIGLYAGGMTAREIRHHLESTIGVDLSRGTISKVTDAVCDAVMEWQRRPLEAFYPVIYLDAIRVKVRPRPPGVEPLGPHRRGRGHGRRQARAGDLDPGRGGGLLEGRRVCADLANRGVLGAC